MTTVSQSLLGYEAELAARREPYVRATVVWRRQPASGKAGAKAVVTTDGKLRGWVGGACAEPVVIRESLRALQEGTPRLLHLGRPGELTGASEGRVSVPISCASEGALEVFIEPHLPRPHLVIIGRAPLVGTLASMARQIGFEVVVVDRDGEAEVDADQIVPRLDLQAAGVGAATFVVVATVGHYDEEALAAAVATDAPYIALVASHKRSATVLDFLRGTGATDEQLARVRAPAGLDLGPVAHNEIAVSILAEIVQLKAHGVGSVRPVIARREAALDPVCGMMVDVASAHHTLEHDGTTFYFCCPGCRGRFKKQPDKFLALA